MESLLISMYVGQDYGLLGLAEAFQHLLKQWSFPSPSNCEALIDNAGKQWMLGQSAGQVGMLCLRALARFPFINKSSKGPTQKGRGKLQATSILFSSWLSCKYTNFFPLLPPPKLPQCLLSG